MLRRMSALAAVVACLALVAQGSGGEQKKTRPDLYGVIKTVKKAAEGAKGLGTITVHTRQKGDEEGKDVTIKVGKKTEIGKGKGKGQPPDPAEFGDLSAGQIAIIWLREGRKDAASRIIIIPGKKKAD